MGSWTFDELTEAGADFDGPANKRAAAKKRLRMESDARLNSQKPVADEPFEQVVNRLEGMPQKAPDVVINVGPTLAITTEQIFARIDTYLDQPSGGSFDLTAVGTKPSLPADVPQQRHEDPGSPGRSDGEADSEGPEDERGDAPSLPPGGEREPGGPVGPD
jgi:hypothetical protein